MSLSENTSVEPDYRHGWRGISAPTTFTVDRMDPQMGCGWFAINDDNDGDVALSVWTDAQGWGQRHLAVWLKPDAARRLAAELVEMADKQEGR